MEYLAWSTDESSGSETKALELDKGVGGGPRRLSRVVSKQAAEVSSGDALPRGRFLMSRQPIRRYVMRFSFAWGDF